MLKWFSFQAGAYFACAGTVRLEIRRASYGKGWVLFKAAGLVAKYRTLAEAKVAAVKLVETTTATATRHWICTEVREIESLRRSIFDGQPFTRRASSHYAGARD